jgi:hypothetical protein
MILDEATSKHSGATRWEFNVFALTLDFDAGLAWVEDLLTEGESESADLRTFLEASTSFGDDTTEGDGLTAAERHPPTYKVDRHGNVEALDD